MLGLDAVGFRRVPPGARRDLLRVLSSPSNVRADVIRQFYERGDDAMVNVLIELEEDEFLRAQVLLMLEASLEEGTRG